MASSRKLNSKRALEIVDATVTATVIAKVVAEETTKSVQDETDLKEVADSKVDLEVPVALAEEDQSSSLV
jgi:hypothetical protein